MPRPLVASINSSALQHNLEVAKACAPHAKVWAVVKANAYGHGLGRAMRAFTAADGLALIELDGAIQLRQWGWQKPILLLEGFFEFDDLATVVQHHLDVVVHCNEQINMLEQIDAPTAQLTVHLKMNTGMNRLGFKPDAFRAALGRLQAMSVVKKILCITHFANADDAENVALPLALQMQRFDQGCNALCSERSVANSAADLLHAELALDWVRPGIMLYGASPGAKTAEQFGLRPAMTLRSELIGLQEIDAGEAVGYGSLFVADQPMKIGVVACGYADGYPRHAPTGTPILVDGVKTRIVGRVSMDMITVDITAIKSARIGSSVTLWGEGLPIDDVAHAAGTIGYELMCALAPRVQIIEC